MSLPLELPSFGQIEPARVIADDDSFAVISDKFPVSPGHTLVIAKRPVDRYERLTSQEKVRLLHWLDWTIAHLRTTLVSQPDGFNIGTNDGPAAGQTVPQLHWHIIPRFMGDVPDPRGGVRFVIPKNAQYW